MLGRTPGNSTSYKQQDTVSEHFYHNAYVSKVQLPKYLVEEVLRSSVDGDGSNDDRLDSRVPSPSLL